MGGKSWLCPIETSMRSADKLKKILTEKNMKQGSASATLMVAALTAIVSPCALADAAGWYGGLNLGQSRAKIDDARIINGLMVGGFSSATIADDDRDTGYKLFGGYQLNRHFAVEAGYFDLGKFAFKATTIPLGTFGGDIKVRGVNLDLVGILPLSEKFSAFGRIGVNRAKADDTFSGTGLVRVLKSSASQRATNAKAGLGLQYALNDSLGVRAEVERYRINDGVGNRGDIDLISLGLVYRFGARKPVYVARTTTPEPVAVAPRVVLPEPAPPVVTPPPVAVPPPPRKFTFSADALFEFDKANIKPEGRQALDKFAADLAGTTYDLIMVTGHTDRLGSRAYNAALSTRRADAVKAYLVAPAGIPAARITARGVDESQPVTKPGECKGKSATKALIACLQPDRRVEVEVSGTK
jgi:OmpA-OmpF porin, OOP family